MTQSPAADADARLGRGGRFGPIRSVPPPGVLDRLSGSPAGWRVERIGGAGGFPNGGLWRFRSGPASVVVKRCGARYLGDSRVWRGRADPADPQWWGREAAFYESDLAVTGWPSDARAARCYMIDGHDGCRDLWLEDLDIPTVSLNVYARASAALARWQVAHATAPHGWLSGDWIPTHIGRHRLDNARTLAHPGWEPALARGLDPAVRDAVATRVTDPETIRRRLAGFPQVLTHYDFHHANIGTVDGQVGIIDWAYLGWGPIGHDVGHLAIECCGELGLPLPDVWHALETAYYSALTAADWDGDREIVRQSMATSNALRLGWAIDHLLDIAEQIPDQALRTFSDQLCFLAHTPG